MICRTLSFIVLAAGSALVFPPRAFGDNAATSQPARHQIYACLLDPREHPDDSRRHVRPPNWDTFGGRTRFTSLRGFGVTDGRIVNYREEIEKYVVTHELGEVLWPSYECLFGANLGDVAEEIKRRGLFLFDVWGYVPGSGPGGYWQQFKPPPGVFDMLESKLGERWLGMDVGEQDGRYIGGYASQMHPASAGRFEQYLHFQRHFQRMCDDLGNRMSTLVSLNYGHYLLKEGVFTTIGAETAQALPNGQVYYAFIRGAGKQYGVPWFGNASVFNRWGYKAYGPPAADHGPTKGTSLSLMKRLLYSHILYNCVFVGFESGWFDGDKLSPIGRIQQAAQRWVKQNGRPGVMLTPVALMTDFFAGWTFPRHLYTSHAYRVWGNLPYEAGDYLTDGVLDMLYPGYQDSSYYHDESGFLSATPYGDSADFLLSDAPGWLLRRYPVLVIAGPLTGGAELYDKLTAYVQGGGRLVITAGNVAKLPSGLAGIGVAGEARRFPAGTAVQFGTASLVEDRPFELCSLALPDGARVRARCGDAPAVVDVHHGNGSITVLASPFGVTADRACGDAIPSDVDKPLAKPYPLLKHVRATLDEVLRSQILFDAGEGLSVITCRREPGRYTLGICNNSWRQRPLRIVSRCGPLVSTRELPLDQSDKGAVGYAPEGTENAALGTSGDTTIAGGDVRIFDVRVREEGVEELPHVVPPQRPRGRILPLRNCRSIKEDMLARPTFFEHFDGVLVDAGYLRQRDEAAIRAESDWIGRQKLRVVVDLTRDINLYPGLRLVENDKDEYAASLAAIDDVLAKMKILGARDLLLSLHRHPENNFTDEQTTASFDATLRRICKTADGHGIAVHLRLCPGKPPWDVKAAAQLIARVGSPNLRLAPSLALLAAAKTKPADIANVLRDNVGMWLVAAPEFDVAGRLWNAHGRIATCKDIATVTEFLKIAPDSPVVFDAIYEGQDTEYLDARVLAAR